MVYMLTIILITLFFSFKAIAKQDIHDDTATKDQHNNNNNDSNYHRTIVIWKRNMYVLLDKHIIKIINVQCNCMYKY